MDDVDVWDRATLVALATVAAGPAGLIGALVIGYMLRLLTDPTRYAPRAHR